MKIRIVATLAAAIVCGAPLAASAQVAVFDVGNQPTHLLIEAHTYAATLNQIQQLKNQAQQLVNEAKNLQSTRGDYTSLLNDITNLSAACKTTMNNISIADASMVQKLQQTHPGYVVDPNATTSIKTTLNNSIGATIGSLSAAQTTLQLAQTSSNTAAGLAARNEAVTGTLQGIQVSNNILVELLNSVNRLSTSNAAISQGLLTPALQKAQQDATNYANATQLNATDAAYKPKF